jgi:GRAM domain
MTTFGSWWLAKHEVLEGETLEFSLSANRTQAQNRAVGGMLFVTNKRILFSPHLIDAATGGTKLQLPLSTISSIDKQAAGGDTFGGGLRARLIIKHSAGTELFVVNKLDEIITKLNMHREQVASSMF